MPHRRDLLRTRLRGQRSEAAAGRHHRGDGCAARTLDRGRAGSVAGRRCLFFLLVYTSDPGLRICKE